MNWHSTSQGRPLDGLCDAFTVYNAGERVKNVAGHWQISRETQDGVAGEHTRDAHCIGGMGTATCIEQPRTVAP